MQLSAHQLTEEQQRDLATPAAGTRSQRRAWRRKQARLRAQQGRCEQEKLSLPASPTSGQLGGEGDSSSSDSGSDAPGWSRDQPVPE